MTNQTLVEELRAIVEYKAAWTCQDGECPTHLGTPSHLGEHPEGAAQEPTKAQERER